MKDCGWYGDALQRANPGNVRQLCHNLSLRKFHRPTPLHTTLVITIDTRASAFSFDDTLSHIQRLKSLLACGVSTRNVPC
jgi:hypothetical protein